MNISPHELHHMAVMIAYPQNIAKMLALLLRYS